MQAVLLCPWAAATTTRILFALVLSLFLSLLQPPHSCNFRCEAAEVTREEVKKLKTHLRMQMELRGEIQTLVQTVRTNLAMAQLFPTPLPPFDPYHVLYTAQEQRALASASLLQLLEHMLHAVTAKRRRVAEAPQVASSVDCEIKEFRPMCDAVSAGAAKLRNVLLEVEEELLHVLGQLLPGLFPPQRQPQQQQLPQPSPPQPPSPPQHPATDDPGVVVKDEEMEGHDVYSQYLLSPLLGGGEGQHHNNAAQQHQPSSSRADPAGHGNFLWPATRGENAQNDDGDGNDLPFLDFLDLFGDNNIDLLPGI